MAVIKEVGVKIESSIENLDATGLADGEAEKNTAEAQGFLHCRDGLMLLTYSENGEGGEVYSEILVKNGSVRVKRKGAIESDICFEEGCEHNSIYSVPPYKFDACVTTRRIRNTLTEDGGMLDLFYNMKIGGADKSARMRIWILPISKQS
jgi:uncharacterized beta-barrel protein YwiB (DUF1934 family)